MFSSSILPPARRVRRLSVMKISHSFLLNESRAGLTFPHAFLFFGGAAHSFFPLFPFRIACGMTAAVSLLPFHFFRGTFQIVRNSFFLSRPSPISRGSCPFSPMGVFLFFYKAQLFSRTLSFFTRFPNLIMFFYQ